jgi:hypothetical protein
MAAVVEDGAHVSLHEKCIDDGAAPNGVFHVIGNRGAAITRGEAVLVSPHSVRAVSLLVDEPMRGFPGGNFAFPGNRDAAQSQAVADARTASHRDRSGGNDLEFQKWWSDALEVADIGKKQEYVVDRLQQPDF